ncbi:hypothetical protein M153_5940001963 [Pseudoloma neurophilia]|uniref:Uncharacterized protein n=1 Tax=Pseudoloma neurophilia TaxID=146866 RepID=A0A0R0M0S2_9MICR|nr:hypothetical protein M153_5940001963 [Pseudoloma neurophilia]
MNLFLFEFVFQKSIMTTFDCLSKELKLKMSFYSTGCFPVTYKQCHTS